MEVIATKRDLSTMPDTPGVKLVDLKTLLEQSDIVSLHASANPSTNHLLNANTLSLLKDNAIVVNTARGSLIDEKALCQWLLAHPHGSALLDVMQHEPALIDHPLYRVQNCTITPHQAWIGQHARIILLQGIVQNIKKYLEGTLQSIDSH
jgi:phosphoglycerate dehydrogenase-like enzyme